MSSYDKRYNVSVGFVSHYTDDPAEALRLLDMEKPTDAYPAFCTEGYADYEDVYYGHREYRGIEGTIVTRRTKGPVTRGQLRLRITQREFREQRALVQKMIEAGRA